MKMLTLDHETRGHLVPELDCELLDKSRESMVNGWRSLFGVSSSGTWPQFAVVELMDALGFDADDPFLIKLIKHGEVTPDLGECGPEWTDYEIGRLMWVLHDKRRWLPGRFWDDKTVTERALDMELGAKAIGVLDHLSELGPGELSRRLGMAGNPRLRKLFHMAANLQPLCNRNNVKAV